MILGMIFVRAIELISSLPVWRDKIVLAVADVSFLVLVVVAVFDLNSKIVVMLSIRTGRCSRRTR